MKGYVQDGSLKSNRCLKSGRKPAITAAEDRILIRNLRKNPIAKAYQLQQEWRASGVNVGVHTVRNRLNKLGCKNVTTKKQAHAEKAT